MAKRTHKAHKGFHLCKDYFGFGIMSLFAGLAFLTVTFLTTVNIVKIFVIGFFVILGIIDLTLYYFFREK